MLETKSIVSQFSIVIAEYLLVQIPKEMERLHADIGALQLPLEQAPEVFHSVGVDLPVNVPFGMVNDLVRESLFLEANVGHEGIAMNRGTSGDVSFDSGVNELALTVVNNARPNFATTLQNPHDRSFVFGASHGDAALPLVRVHETGSTANESLIHFDWNPRAAQWHSGAILHSQANPMEHEPCGLLSDAQSASHFIAADPVFAIGDHPNCDEPLIQRQRGILEDSPNLDGELFASVFALALPEAASGEEAHLGASASGADNAIRPAALNHEREAIVGIGEVDYRLLESLWFGAHGVPHKQNCTKEGLLSQVYYCPYKKRGGIGYPAPRFSPIASL